MRTRSTSHPLGSLARLVPTILHSREYLLSCRLLFTQDLLPANREGGEALIVMEWSKQLFLLT
jgi:hypothetical protein